MRREHSPTRYAAWCDCAILRGTVAMGADVPVAHRFELLCCTRGDLQLVRAGKELFEDPRRGYRFRGQYPLTMLPRPRRLTGIGQQQPVVVLAQIVDKLTYAGWRNA